MVLPSRRRWLQLTLLIELEAMAYDRRSKFSKKRLKQRLSKKEDGILDGGCQESLGEPLTVSGTSKYSYRLSKENIEIEVESGNSIKEY